MVRAPLWQGRGRELLGPIAYIDVDGTLAPDVRQTETGHGHLLQGDLGIRPAGRVAGQHQGSALRG